jgi:hypothetical protein
MSFRMFFLPLHFFMVGVPFMCVPLPFKYCVSLLLCLHMSFLSPGANLE